MVVVAVWPLLGCLLFNTVASSVLPRGQDDSGGHNWIDHDKVVALTQNASPGVDGQLELRFSPFLYVAGGCDPYPATDASGNLGGGLKPTNGGRSGCDKGGNAQVYARRGSSQGRTGIMYSYYMPKVRWAKGNDNGHRHYWASAVVWINRWGCVDDDVTAVWPVGISFTTDHLTWGTANAGDFSFKSMTVGVDMPTHPKIQIHDTAIAPFTGADGDKVFERTLVGWDSLPDAAAKALQDVKYEKTQVPFTDANFQAQMDAAYRESFYGALKDQQGCDAGRGGSPTPTTQDPDDTTPTDPRATNPTESDPAEKKR
ncbi:hypothetical protein CGMCC3_g16265 [Colletotrichum fructicola]|uniref:Npp1 domain protein n=1 Tax=Colletotrichum fructicola (strain Nara gc5) TaxID=1213859 RepID=L2FKC6_COLFN|nr:uncharacterized protein CGMCC3_g16265 [Colletotrichum fructicola]KAE9567582.1 hypothetical protein CGMCC3_g16265 [Colletotrichum fructicola]KAF4420755.1 hypothetical protein CFRS1_v005171 [Colletotrichum fructicola]KAF4475453.1 hypothetical protein CGGC5_v016293 [Colletotrichum fructicola Nara gc5]KAF4885654.1 hypothetical protein CGCFRS4_v011799 [Colletotrichum fructicola]